MFYSKLALFSYLILCSIVLFLRELFAPNNNHMNNTYNFFGYIQLTITSQICVISSHP